MSKIHPRRTSLPVPPAIHLKSSLKCILPEAAHPTGTIHSSQKVEIIQMPVNVQKEYYWCSIWIQRLAVSSQNCFPDLRAWISSALKSYYYLPSSQALGLKRRNKDPLSGRPPNLLPHPFPGEFSFKSQCTILIWWVQRFY